MVETDLRAVLDANVLANIHICDLLLRLAEEPATYQPIWSLDILDETQRTHLKLGYHTGVWALPCGDLRTFPAGEHVGKIRIHPNTQDCQGRVCCGHRIDQFDQSIISNQIMNAISSSPTIQQYDLVHTCRKCDRVCLEKGRWVEASEIKIKLADSSLSHGICPACIRADNPEFSTQMFKKVDGEMMILDATDLVHA